MPWTPRATPLFYERSTSGATALPSGGTLDSALGASTMRTKGTIDQLAAKYFSD